MKRSIISIYPTIKTNTQNLVIKGALLLLLSISSETLFAQPEFDDDVQDTPIDGGVGLLIAAGAGYVINQLRKKGNSEENID